MRSLEASTAVAAADQPSIKPKPLMPPTIAPTATGRPARGVAGDRQHVRDLSSLSPAAALNQVKRSIERELRLLLAATGHADEALPGASLIYLLVSLEVIELPLPKGRSKLCAHSSRQVRHSAPAPRRLPISSVEQLRRASGCSKSSSRSTENGPSWSTLQLNSSSIRPGSMP